MKIKILLIHSTGKIDPWFQEQIDALKAMIQEQGEYEFIDLPEIYDHEKFIDMKIGLIEKADIVLALISVPSTEVGILIAHAENKKHVLAVSEIGRGERSPFVRKYKRKRENYTFLHFTKLGQVVEKLEQIKQAFFSKKTTLSIE